MKIPELPVNEPQRLRALYDYDILDTPAEKEFDDITRLASRICKKPISLVTLLDVNRQWFKSRVGFDVSETPREVAFCAHAIHGDQIMEIKDATQDERFNQNPLVRDDPKIRFYAGMPLTTSDGFRLGTLCVIDNQPGTLDDDQRLSLQVLARQVIKLFELRLKVKESEKLALQAEMQRQESERLHNISSKLISILSHDLKSPLTTLRGFLHIFREQGIEQEEMDKFMQGIDQMLDTSTDLLENLMQWGSSQMNGGEMRLQELDLHALVREVLDHLRAAADLKENTLINTVPTGLMARVDQHMIAFVLRNLVQNANKFTEKGSILVSIREDEDYYYLSVADNGSGMGKIQMDKLFHWDYRVSTSGTRGEKGSGMGLLICREFVEMHQGEIYVDSEIGRGTTFTFSISRHLAD